MSINLNPNSKFEVLISSENQEQVVASLEPQNHSCYAVDGSCRLNNPNSTNSIFKIARPHLLFNFIHRDLYKDAYVAGNRDEYRRLMELNLPKRMEPHLPIILRKRSSSPIPEGSKIVIFDGNGEILRKIVLEEDQDEVNLFPNGFYFTRLDSYRVKYFGPRESIEGISYELVGKIEVTLPSLKTVGIFEIVDSNRIFKRSAFRQIALAAGWNSQQIREFSELSAISRRSGKGIWVSSNWQRPVELSQIHRGEILDFYKSIATRNIQVEKDLIEDMERAFGVGVPDNIVVMTYKPGVEIICARGDFEQMHLLFESQFEWLSERVLNREEKIVTEEDLNPSGSAKEHFEIYSIYRPMLLANNIHVFTDAGRSAIQKWLENLDPQIHLSDKAYEFLRRAIGYDPNDCVDDLQRLLQEVYER